MQLEQSKSDESTKGNGAGMPTVAPRSLEMEARRKRVAALLKEGKGASEISRRLKVNDATIYSDIRVLKGLPAYGAKGKGKGKGAKVVHPKMSKAAQGRVPMGVYTLAKNLRKAVRGYVMDRGGDVDDLAMTATALTKALLGE